MLDKHSYPFIIKLKEHLKDASPYIQAILGPRQVGKTTGILLFLKNYSGPYHYAGASSNENMQWIIDQWQTAILKSPSSLLVLDEIQKIPQWSEIIKKLWDEQKKNNGKLKCIILGSSSLSLQKGLSESLTGRFELIRAYHWNFHESSIEFKWDLQTYLQYGGYPGSYKFIKKRARWLNFIKNSIIDTVTTKDILQLAHVRSPALFRQTFDILCDYPAQEISYTKLLGQLQDKGNTDLIKHYIELYEGAFILKAIFKYSTKPVVTKTSSPKIIPLSPAFMYSKSISDPENLGHIFEAAVGAELVRLDANLYYWREDRCEVDFILEYDQKLYAIEVKSGRRKSPKGLNVFCEQHKNAIPIIITLENFKKFSENPGQFLNKLS